MYQQAVDRLRDELGVDPGSTLRQAHQAVIAEPAPQTVRAPRRAPVLVGRDEALDEGHRVLASQSPWLAVTGPGGVGKTTLALSLADRSRPLFPDGVLVTRRGTEPVDESMLTRFLGAFGITAGTQLPGNPRDRAEMLWELLGARRVLLVLDDVPDETHVRPLLPTTPGCGLVVTSRRRLAGLDTLHGLPLAIKVAAAWLATRPNWTVGDLARRLADTRDRLDWLRVGDLEVRASLEESLSGLTAGQRRPLARLGLLDTAEFAGWVTAALLDEDLWLAERLLDDLVEAHLVEPAGHGVTGPRYRMHELIRLVAAELADDGDLAATTRLRHGWLALAAVADDQLGHWFGLDPAPEPAWQPPEDTVTAVAAEPMRWFDEEQDALMAAVRGAGDAVSWVLAQRLATYHELRGRYEDWVTVLRAGLAAADELHDRQGQATMLGLLMHAEATRGDHQFGMRYAALAFVAYQELGAPPPVTTVPSVSNPSLDDARRDGDVLAVGFHACRLALTLRIEGARIDYLALFEEAVDAFRIGRIPLLELWTIKNIGLVYLRRRQRDKAAECLRRGHEIFQDSANDVAAGGDLAGSAAAHGRLDLAEQLVETAIADADRTGDSWSAARALHTVADLRASRGDPGAARTYRKALVEWTDLRMPRRVAQVEEALSRLGFSSPGH